MMVHNVFKDNILPLVDLADTSLFDIGLMMKTPSFTSHIDLDTIDVNNVTYLHSSFGGDVLHILPPLSIGVPSTYGMGMNGLDKIYGSHAWCTTRTTNIQNEFGLTI